MANCKSRAELLTLTFMNGARRRLETRLSEEAAFRRRYECQTFDVFARTLAARRRSLLSGNVAVIERAAALNEFDRPCFLAASLLDFPSVQQWVARTFPLVLIDEAQDLNEHRFPILQGLSHSCPILAAADAFQCLEGRTRHRVFDRLDGERRAAHRLTQVRRTRQQGLLAAALAIRDGGDIRTVLTAKSVQRQNVMERSGISSSGSAR